MTSLSVLNRAIRFSLNSKIKAITVTAKTKVIFIDSRMPFLTLSFSPAPMF